MGFIENDDLVAFRGFEFLDDLEYREKSNSDGSLGPLIDLTGYTARMIIKEDPSSLVVDFELNTTNGFIMLGAASIGSIHRNIPKVNIDSFVWSKKSYGMILVPPSGGAFPFLKGCFEIRRWYI